MQCARIAFSLFIGFLLIGCSTLQRSTHIRNELPELTDTKILYIVLNSGQKIIFNPQGGQFLPNSVSDTTGTGTVVGIQHNGTPVSIPSANIREIHTEEEQTDVGGTVVETALIGTAGIAAGVFIAVLIAFSHLR